MEMRWIEIVKKDQINNPEIATDLMYEQDPAGIHVMTHTRS